MGTAAARAAYEAYHRSMARRLNISIDEHIGTWWDALDREQQQTWIEVAEAAGEAVASEARRAALAEAAVVASQVAEGARRAVAGLVDLPAGMSRELARESAATGFMIANRIRSLLPEARLVACPTCRTTALGPDGPCPDCEGGFREVEVKTRNDETPGGTGGSKGS